MIRPAAIVAALVASLMAMPLSAAAQQALDQQAEAAQDASRPLPLTQEIRDTSNEALQQTLYELYALQLAAHQEHWVVGEEFHQLHEFYEEL